MQYFVGFYHAVTSCSYIGHFCGKLFLLNSAVPVILFSYVPILSMFDVLFYAENSIANCIVQRYY